MKKVGAYLQDYKFNSIFIKNLMRMLLVLVLPVAILSTGLTIIVSNWQTNGILATADKASIAIASELDAIWLQHQNTAFSVSNDRTIRSYSSYLRSSLTANKLKALSQLQARLASASTSVLPGEVALLYVNESSMHLVTAKTALSATRIPQRRRIAGEDFETLIDLALKAKTHSQAAHSRSSLIFFCQSAYAGDYKIYSFVILGKETAQRWLTQTHRVDNFYMLDSQSNFLLSSPLGAEDNDWAHVLNQSHQDKLPMVSTGGQKFFATAHPSDTDHWEYLYLFPPDQYHQAGRIISFFVISVMILVVAFSIFSSWRVSLSLYRPISIIISLLKKPELASEEYYRQYCMRYDEMNMISDLIQDSHFQQLAITKELDERQKKLQKAQNYALAAQINPHFIFNTLGGINWRVQSVLGAKNDISTAISDFSQLMRYSLNSHGTVSLIDEIDHVRLYIKLRNSQKEKFTTQWEVDEALLAEQVPFLILQPIVENAITHGIGKMGGKGHLHIHCRAEEGQMILSVIDNGQGFTTAQLNKLRIEFDQDILTEDSGIGLVNTHHRIRLIFGEEWGIRLQSYPGHTQVSLHMPRNEQGGYTN